MSDNMSARIEAMFKQDRLWALGFVVLLWLSYGFVFLAIDSVNTDPTIRWALIIGGGLVVLYNTASIVAMIKHYVEDKENIYSIDIRHLDEMRSSQGK